MEDMNLIDDTSIEGGINAQIKTYLMETAKWAKFVAIVSIIMGGLMALGGLFAGTTMSQESEISPIPGGGAIFVVIYLVLAAIVITPSVFLYNFASKAINALRSGSEGELTVAFENLKSYFKFVGIMTAIGLSLYTLILIAVLFGGAMTGF